MTYEDTAALQNPQYVTGMYIIMNIRIHYQYQLIIIHS